MDSLCLLHVYVLTGFLVTSYPSSVAKCVTHMIILAISVFSTEGGIQVKTFPFKDANTSFLYTSFWSDLSFVGHSSYKECWKMWFYLGGHLSS